LLKLAANFHLPISISWAAMIIDIHHHTPSKLIFKKSIQQLTVCVIPNLVISLPKVHLKTYPYLFQIRSLTVSSKKLHCNKHVNIYEML
jgi:hypothetical protein